MRVKAIVGALGLLVLGASAAQAIVTIDSWPADIDKTPCSIWSRKADGTWVQLEPVQNGSGMNYWGYWFKNNQYSRLLDDKCGK